MSTNTPITPADLINPTTIYSLTAITLILTTAVVSARTLLPTNTTLKHRFLFTWHFFDAAIHFLIEAPFLYNCFATYRSITKALPGAPTLPMTAPGVYFLNQPSRLYGAFYGDGITAKLWQEYARADKRWGGADLVIISLEILTVGIMAPLAVWVCVSLARGDAGKAWFGMVIVATGELYGGWMTFAPEWLTGSPNLDTSNWMYLWLYLTFFNGLWVAFPAWILYEAYGLFSGALGSAGKTTVTVEQTSKGATNGKVDNKKGK